MKINSLTSVRTNIQTGIREHIQSLRPDRSHLQSDAIAGLTFAVANVPQAMAHALLAAVNPVLGIYTLMVAISAAALVTSSVYMNVSTTSALSLAAGDGLAGISAAQRPQALVMLVLLVGLIILGQIGELTGFQSRFANNVVRALNLLLRPDQIDLPTTIIGVLTLALIVRTVGDIATTPRALPALALPPLALLPAVLLPALSVAIIGLIQGAGVSQSNPNPDGKYPDVSRDVLGQGVANLAASLVGGVPAGGSISGTVLMLSAGATSRWANILAGLCVA